MSRLIDADKLKEYIKIFNIGCGCSEDYQKSFMDAIDAQTEIIRCKDCYWWDKQQDSLQGRCARYGTYPTGYWYCASARERRKDEQG